MEKIYSLNVISRNKLGKELDEAFDFIDGLAVDDGSVVVFSSRDLTANEESDLDAFIASYDNTYYIKDIATQKRLEAIRFGQNLIGEHIDENIAMGITQMNKSKQVADFLTLVFYYLSSGTLTGAIDEINTLIASGLPSDLSPFITETRLNAVKQKILNYIGA